MIDDDSAVAGGSEPAVPASPRTPYSERPVARARRAKAQELIERLFAEGRVRTTDPVDDEVAEWRRVVNYAKRHGLEPAGKRIEKVPYGGPGLELFLADGPHPNARSQRPKAGGVDVAVDGFAYIVTVKQELPESTAPERSVRLVVELVHGLTGRSGRWRDRKTRTLEEALGVILGEIEARAVEDGRRRQEGTSGRR
jgi:hypothetical protein